MKKILFIPLIFLLSACVIDPAVKSKKTFWERTMEIGNADLYQRANQPCHVDVLNNVQCRGWK